jgi:hypothetical protein
MVVGTLAECPSVRGVFRMGSIRDPGISDLDLIIVAADTASLGEIPDLRAAHPAVAYVMMHSPFLVDQATFPRIRYLAGLSQLVRLSGSALAPNDEEVPAVVRLHLAAKYALDGLWFQCRQLALMTLRIRSTLCALNTLAHLMELVRDVVDAPLQAVALVEAIRRLRDQWFVEPDTTALWDLVSNAVPAYLALLDAIGAAHAESDPAGTPVLSWSNLQVVVSDENIAEAIVGTPRICDLLDRFFPASRHLDDLRWMLRTCTVRVTGPTGNLLRAGAHPLGETALRQRTDLLLRYRAWLGEATGPFAMLCPRVDSPEPTGIKWRGLALTRRWFS